MLNVPLVEERRERDLEGRCAERETLGGIHPPWHGERWHTLELVGLPWRESAEDPRRVCGDAAGVDRAIIGAWRPLSFPPADLLLPTLPQTGKGPLEPFPEIFGPATEYCVGSCAEPAVPWSGCSGCSGCQA